MYFQEGNKEYRKGELRNAIYFYTEGINVSCEDDELNAKLYSNRAAAHFSLGEFMCAVHAKNCNCIRRENSMGICKLKANRYKIPHRSDANVFPSLVR